MSVIEDAADIQLMTEVTIQSELLIENGEKNNYTRWQCTSTGAIGRGRTEDESRNWMFLAENDQKGSVSFGISDDAGTTQECQFKIDVSSALQEGKITLFSDFPFHLKMEGRGIVESIGGVLAKGTQINYKIVNIF